MGEHGISIDGTGIANLGDQLGAIADQLEDAASATSDMAIYGFPSGVGERGLDKVHGDQERMRIEVCRQLRDLRDLARDAGGCYIRTEQLIDHRFRGQF